MRVLSRTLVAALALSACGDPVAPAPQPVSATIHELQRDVGQVVVPGISITGGDRIRIRGTFNFCGDPRISASRVRSEISVEIGSPPRICIAIFAPLPYQGELHDLPAGRYTVHVRAMGSAGRETTAVVTIDPN